MALSFPSWAEPIEWLVGADWPHGNEDLMREMGRDLDDVAKDIRALIPELDGIISGLKEVYPEGSGGEKIVAWMQPLRDSADGNHGSLEKFAANYELLSQSADSMGDQLEAAKLNFYISFGWVLAELALAAMSGPVGWFSSSAIFATARAAFRVIANTLFGRIAAIIARIAGGRISEAMVKRVLMEGLQEALVETLQGTSQELLVQTIQKQSGNIDGYNWDAVWKNAAVSAVAGGAGGLTGGLASLRFDTRMGGRQGALNGAVVGGLGGLGGALAAGLVTGEFDPRSLTGGIFSGAGPGAIRGLRGSGTVAVNIDRMPTAPTLDGAVPTVEPVTAADPAAALTQPAQAGDPNSPANSPQSTQPAGSSGDPGKGATESPEAGDPAAARATESEPTDSAPPAADSRRDSDARETSDESGAPRHTTGTTHANSPDSGASHQSTGDTGPADRGSQDRSNAGDPAADTRSASPDPATSEARAAADTTTSGTDSTATSADRPADTTPASASPNGQAPSAGAPNGLTGASPAAPTAVAPGTSGPGTAGAQSAASAQPAGTSPAAPNTSSPAAPPPSGSTATPGSSTPGSSTPGSSTQNPAPSQQPAHPHESGRTSRPDGAASLDATTDGSRPPVVASPSRAGLVDAAPTSPFTAAPQAISTGVAVDPATSTSSATDTDSTPAAALVAPVALFVAATDTPRTAPRMPWDGRDSGQRGTASPVGEFHGDARPAGQPDLDTAQLLTAISDNLLLITPETVSWNRDGGHFVLPDGRRIHLTIAATANGAVAQFGPATDDDGYEVRVSPRARTSDVPRALAHELAEIALSLDPDIDIDPVTETPTTMTTHLGGRFAELRVLLSQIDRATFDPARAAELPALRRDLADLSAHLDLDDPAGSRNRDLLRDHDPRLAQRFGLEQNNPFAARPTIGPDTDLAADTAPYDARLEGHLDGEYADSLRRMENAGLQGRIREELARRVFDPLFTGPEAKAARRTVPTPDLLSALDPINAALNDTTTTEAQRARAVSAAIDGFRDAMPQAFRDTFGDSGFQRMYDAAADLANHPRRITAELDQNAGTVTGDGRPLSFVDFLRDVDHANRGATALGVDVEYTVVVHDPVDGRSAVEILPRPRPQHRLPLPQNVFGEDDHRIEHQPRPAASATAAGAHTIDVGVGRSAFGVEMTPAADRAAGGLIIKTELASEFPVAAQRRRDRGILDPGPLTAPGTMMVFGDLLSNGGALVHGGTGTVGRIFINNVSAHFDPSQYDALAAQLVRSLAPGGRIELQWDTKPESETGYVNDRGHIDGDRLFAALQRLYPDTDLPFRVQERTEFPPPGNSDYDYTIDAGGSNVLNRAKMAEFSAPRPDHRMVIVYEPAGTGVPSDHHGAAAAVGDFHGHARPDDRPDLTDRQLHTEIENNLDLIDPHGEIHSTEPGHYILPDGTHVRVRLAPAPGDDVATFERTDDGYEVHVSPRARTVDIPRAIAHEFAEIVLAQQDSIDPDPTDDQPATMTAHLGGRFAELRVLLTQIEGAADDPTLANLLPALRRDLADLADTLGLHDPDRSATTRALLHEFDASLADRANLAARAALIDSLTAVGTDQDGVRADETPEVFDPAAYRAWSGDGARIAMHVEVPRVESDRPAGTRAAAIVAIVGANGRIGLHEVGAPAHLLSILEQNPAAVPTKEHLLETASRTYPQKTLIGARSLEHALELARQHFGLTEPHDHAAVPLNPDTKVLADLNNHPDGVTRDADGLITHLGDRPIQEVVDAIARDRATKFVDERTAPAGESDEQKKARQSRWQRKGIQLSPNAYGKVSAVVVDRRTGIVYEGFNGSGKDTLTVDDTHATIEHNVEEMRRKGRELDGGGYPNLNRHGELEDSSPVREFPQFDSPYGHAEVKAANEALWARTALGLDDSPAAMAELYSQTYSLVPTRNAEGDIVVTAPKPYCANCHGTMGQAANYSGRYPRYPHGDDEITGAYTPSPAHPGQDAQPTGPDADATARTNRHPVGDPALQRHPVEDPEPEEEEEKEGR